MAKLTDLSETLIHEVKWKNVSTAMKTHFNISAYIIIILINIRYFINAFIWPESMQYNAAIWLLIILYFC